MRLFSAKKGNKTQYPDWVINKCTQGDRADQMLPHDWHKVYICFEWGVKKRLAFSSTVEDLKTALNTITLKSMGFGFSSWNKWFLEKGLADEIESTTQLSFTLCLSKFFYAKFKSNTLAKIVVQIASKK